MSQAYLWYVRTGAGVIEVNRLTLLVVFVPVGETLRLERKGTKKETTLRSLSHLGFLHATSPSLHLSACKNMRWDKDLKVVSFFGPFSPQAQGVRVSVVGSGTYTQWCYRRVPAVETFSRDIFFCPSSQAHV